MIDTNNNALLTNFAVMNYFNLHTHSRSSDPDVISLLNRYPEEYSDAEEYFSIGIHPWRIHEVELYSELAIVEKAVTNEKCLAIGECGIDKRIEMPLNKQRNVFELQLDLAMKYRKPVILHCVAAFQEVIGIKNERKIDVPLIIHGFSKNIETAKQLLENGFYLSFGKYLLRNPELEMVFQSIPHDRLFLETDTIQEDIKEVYAKAAAYLGLTVEEIGKIINDNVRNVFGVEVRSNE